MRGRATPLKARTDRATPWEGATVPAPCRGPQDFYTLDATRPDNQWLTVVVRDGDALLTACKTADRVYCKVAAVGGDTDQQPYTEVLSRLVQ